MSFHKILIASILGIFIAIGPNRAKADVINFTGVNLATVSSGAGQNFGYTVGGGSSTGNLNVKLISGVLGNVIPGSAPDPTGLYVIQNAPQITNPITLRFEFETLRAFEIRNNETLTTLEINAFTMFDSSTSLNPTGAWTVVGTPPNSDVTNSGSTVSFRGNNEFIPGDYAITGTSQVFDWQITNFTGFPSYGSAISIDVAAVTAIPEPRSVTLFAVVTFVLSLRRRCKVLPRYSPAT